MQVAGEVEESISDALEGFPADERLFVLRDLLLAQVRVCVLHFNLMQLEKSGRLVLSDSGFSSIMDKHLEFAEFFRANRKPEAKSTYEMKSIISLYTLIVHHSTESPAE